MLCISCIILYLSIVVATGSDLGTRTSNPVPILDLASKVFQLDENDFQAVKNGKSGVKGLYSRVPQAIKDKFKQLGEERLKNGGEAYFFIKDLLNNANLALNDVSKTSKLSNKMMSKFDNMSQKDKETLRIFFPSVSEAYSGNPIQPSNPPRGPNRNAADILEKEKQTLQRVQELLKQVEDSSQDVNFSIARNAIANFLKQNHTSWANADIKEIVNSFEENLHKLSVKDKEAADPSEKYALAVRDTIQALQHFCHVLDVKGVSGMTRVFRSFDKLQLDLIESDQISKALTIVKYIESQLQHGSTDIARESDPGTPLHFFEH